MNEQLDNEPSVDTSSNEESFQPTASKKKKGFGKKEPAEIITIPALKLAVVTLSVTGTTPLIVHKFSDKSKRQMLDKQMGEKAHAKRDPKVPLNDFLGSLYVIEGKTKVTHEDGGLLEGGETYAEGKFGFPANALKLAAVSACRHLDGLAMTKALGCFRVMDYLIPILDPKTGKAASARMREDMVRLAPPARAADIRYRAEFTNWMMKVAIQYNTSVISPTQIANLFNTAGYAVGIGEWRMEKKGDMGHFTVANNA